MEFLVAIEDRLHGIGSGLQVDKVADGIAVGVGVVEDDGHAWLGRGDIQAEDLLGFVGLVDLIAGPVIRGFGDGDQEPAVQRTFACCGRGDGDFDAGAGGECGRGEQKCGGERDGSHVEL